MIKSSDLLEYVINPILNYLNLYSEDAAYLLLGTCAKESKGGYYLHQLNEGCAIGIYQMEPKTHNCIWENYLYYRKDLNKKIVGLLPTIMHEESRAKEMHGNLYYATAMARIHYLRVEEKLPDHNDLDAMANYWKKYYNTIEGKGTIEGFKEDYQKFV